MLGSESALLNIAPEPAAVQNNNTNMNPLIRDRKNYTSRSCTLSSVIEIV